MRVFNDFNDLKGALSAPRCVSDWMEITQDRINKFAEATAAENLTVLAVDLQPTIRRASGNRPLPSMGRFVLGAVTA